MELVVTIFIVWAVFSPHRVGFWLSQVLKAKKYYDKNGDFSLIAKERRLNIKRIRREKFKNQK